MVVCLSDEVRLRLIVANMNASLDIVAPMRVVSPRRDESQLALATHESIELEKECARAHKRCRRNPLNITLLHRFRELRLESQRLHSRLLSSFVSSSLRRCTIPVHMWKVFERHDG